MFCDKCGKEIGENMQCECEVLEQKPHSISTEGVAYLPWVYILTAVWNLVLGELFVLNGLVEFAFLGLKAWFLRGGWVPLLIYVGFIALNVFLEDMCNEVGLENIVLKKMDSNMKGTIANVTRICIKVFDLLLTIMAGIGIIGFYRETGTIFSRAILLNPYIFKSLQLSILVEALNVIPVMFSYAESK